MKHLKNASISTPIAPFPKHLMRSLNVLLVPVLLMFALSACGSAEDTYNKAVTQMREGNYAAAAALFEKAGDYSDARDQFAKCNAQKDLQTAKELMASGDYDAADNMLKNIVGVPEVEPLRKECGNNLGYNRAQAQLDAGDAEAAMASFATLGDFKDSKAKVEECRNLKQYNIAKAAFEKADYKTARSSFEMLGDFRDAKEQAKQCTDKIDDERWKLALVQNTYDGYAAFLDNPEGNHYKDALDKCESSKWETALSQNNAAGYKNYLEAFPEGKHAADAQKALEQFQQNDDQNAYNDALAKDTIKSLQEYLAAHPNSTLKQQAEERIKAMQNDPKYAQDVLKNPSEQAARDFLENYPGHVDEAEVSKLLELKSGTLKELVDLKVISVTVNGPSSPSTQRCHLSFQNLTQFPVEVSVPLGTYFIAAKSNIENKIVTRTVKTTISAGGSYQSDIDTASMNISRSAPSAEDTYAIGVLSSESKFTKLLEFLERNPSTYPVTQSTIWILSDGATDKQLQGVLFYADKTPVITAKDVTKARAIVEKL